jgi:hypothetical protein
LPVVTVCANAAALRIRKANVARAALRADAGARKSSDSRRRRDGTTLEVIKVFLQVQDGKENRVLVNRGRALSRMAQP